MRMITLKFFSWACNQSIYFGGFFVETSGFREIPQNFRVISGFSGYLACTEELIHQNLKGGLT